MYTSSFNRFQASIEGVCFILDTECAVLSLSILNNTKMWKCDFLPKKFTDLSRGLVFFRKNLPEVNAFLGKKWYDVTTDRSKVTWLMIWRGVDLCVYSNR